MHTDAKEKYNCCQFDLKTLRDEQQINFTFTISYSGKYTFNLTLLSNNEGQISTYYIEKSYLFNQLSLNKM